MNRNIQLKLSSIAMSFAFAISSANALPTQPPVNPAAGDLGVFATQDQAIGASDPDRAIAYDNFSITTAYNLDAVSWSGVYVEPFPRALSDTDFIVSIFGDDSGAPDVDSGPLMSWNLEGGIVVSLGGPDLMVSPNGNVSPTTSTAAGGGPGFDYKAPIAGQLAAGDYWISILADQSFDNAAPVVDPEWQWQYGSGGDGSFYMEDGALGIDLSAVDSGKDLNFSLSGTIVPEPDSGLPGMFAVVLLLALRRRRGK